MPTVENSAVELLLALLKIPGKSGDEQAVAEFIVRELQTAGIDKAQITFDDAHRKSPIGGSSGNLIVKLPGTVKGPRRLLMAHIDTVPLCVGAKPVRKGSKIVSSDKATALGGDDRSGAAVILHTLLNIIRHNMPHPPLTFLWAVQEEIGLVGARNVATKKLGNPKLCFNWDGGQPNLLTIGATGAFNVEITIHGRASHAGAHPEQGVSAIAIAGLAIQKIVEGGWHGLVVKGKKTGTSNIGVIRGGEATNVVTDQVVLRAEARSHDPVFRKKIVEEFVAAFASAARGIKTTGGETGNVEFDIEQRYDSFKLEKDDPSVAAASVAIQSVGLKPELRISNGGLDANWMTAHGFPTVTLGCGQDGIHTTAETLDVTQFEQACQIAQQLATSGA